jgi:Outer membrane protein beta-barrel family/Carboxypeptidase regulatory-like domain
LASNNRKVNSMLKIPVSIITLLVFATPVKSQIVSGKLRDLVDDSPLAGATVQLSSIKDSRLKFNTISDGKGSFEFRNIPPDSFYLKIGLEGYANYRQLIRLNDPSTSANLGIISIAKKTQVLPGITVTAKIPPAQQKGDTTEYNAGQFKVNPDATVEDLVKKMPGITIDKDGTVTAHGEQVKKVTVDGRDFFGDDATAALRNLPSQVVDKIQVFDRLSDQAQFTGFDDGNSVKSINIVTKSGMKNGQFGRIYAGYGTNDRYSAGGNMSFFKGNRRISLIGLFNNINQQNFASQDLLGITSTNSRGNGLSSFKGGGTGAASRSGGANSNNFMVGQQTGINKTNAAGVNFSEKSGKKLDIQGSYFFNNAANSNDQTLNSQTLLTGGLKQYLNQKSIAGSKNYNHRINMRIEYKIDSSNSIIINPSLNFQKNNSVLHSVSQIFYGASDTASTSENNSSAFRSGYNLGNNILFRHSFSKKGRTLSLNMNTIFNKNDGENFVISQYRFIENNSISDSLQNQYSDNASNGYTLSSNISYTEPLGKKGQLLVNYSPSYSRNKSDQRTFLYDNAGGKYTRFDSILSNLFDNTRTTHNAGISFRRGARRDNQFSAGINLQYSKLESIRTFPTASNVNQSFINLLPNLQWHRKISGRSSLVILYRASTNFPSISQLQDVVNLDNPIRVSSGNPDLRQSYTHYMSGRYTFINTDKGQSFFANIFLQTAENYISNATFIAQHDTLIRQNIVLKSGSQLTKPVNLNGYKSFRSFFTYSMPVKFIKSAINLNGGFTYTNLPGIINAMKTNTSNFIYNAGIVVASNLSEYVDFNLSYSANFNKAKSSLTSQDDNHYVNQAAGIQFNLLSKNGWFLQNDLTNQVYSGLSDGLNQSFWLWNAGIGKKFLKKKQGELKLSVFDLLKQNQSIIRTVSENYIEDTKSQVLQQYFLLTFTYSLKNFGKVPPQRGRKEF